ncbi:MAG TPA: chemotaxis protein CheW [Vicinamibacterales bacterium]
MTDNYILFTVGSTIYGVRSEDVAHVELVDDVTAVPNAPPYVDGVVFSRGAVVPAVNVRARFGFERQPYDARTRLIVVQHESRTVGLVVDAAREFVTIPADVIHPPAEGITRTSGRYLRGVATLGDRMILVLDVAELLNYDELETAAVPVRPHLPQEK